MNRVNDNVEFTTSRLWTDCKLVIVYSCIATKDWSKAYGLIKNVDCENVEFDQKIRIVDCGIIVADALNKSNELKFYEKYVLEFVFRTILFNICNLTYI